MADVCSSRLATLRLAADGAELAPGAGLCALSNLRAALPDDGFGAGVRLQGSLALRELLGADATIGRIAARILGPASRPVRAILFDKNPAFNWALGWHQDRAIAVAKWRPVAGFSAWTVKQGMIHVEPPFEVIESLITLRVHFDPVGPGNAPLLVAPGSHLFGRINEADLSAVVDRCGVEACEAERGDIWVYRTAILHASKAAEVPRRRRVLQVDYTAIDLPGGLQWLGI